MKKYIKIVNYMAGPSLQEQIAELEDNGMIDADTRLFFKKNNSLTMGDVATVMKWFDVGFDDDFSDDNLVFKPRDWYIRSIESEK